MATTILALSLALLIAGFIWTPVYAIAVLVWSILGTSWMFYGPMPKGELAARIALLLLGPLAWFCAWIVHRTDDGRLIEDHEREVAPQWLPLSQR